MKQTKRALIVTTVASTIDQFCMNDIKLLREMGYQIDVAANFSEGNNTSQVRVEQFKHELEENGYDVHNIEFSRSPLSRSNLQAYKKLSGIISEKTYDIIHCHTPIAAFITRLAARESRHNGTRVIYTAHGFHFFKGAPVLNWLIYYPVEKICAKHTDLLITINKEDYHRASKAFRTRVEYIPGVGIDTEAISNTHVDRIRKRNQLGIPLDAVVVLSVGQLNKNKNHEVIIRAIASLRNPNIYYLVCGIGDREDYLRKLSASLNVTSQVVLLGYRQDVIEVCKASDLFAFPSYREGLGVAALEAMAAGLPLVTSKVQGIVDYSIDGLTGYCCEPNDTQQFSQSMNRLIKDSAARKAMCDHNINAARRFDRAIVNTKMKLIYEKIYRGC